MCVIVFKEEGLKPNYKAVTAQWQYNPDYAGLAYFNAKGLIQVEKGFTSPLDLFERLLELSDYDVVYHLRYATHGKVNKSNSHPFEINTVPHHKLHFSTKNAVLFHNGMINGFGSQLVSDTRDFTNNVLARIKDIDTRLAVLRLTGCKFIILQDNMFHFVGEFEEIDGLLCSNSHWDYRHYAETTYKGKTIEELVQEELENEDYLWENDVYTGMKDE